MKRVLLCLVTILFIIQAYASDTIIVRKDPRLDVLSAKQAQLNKRASMMTSTGLYKGFRIQVLSTQSRGEAFKMKTDLLVKYPDEKTYLIFQSPYFKVRIGNYLKREEAEKLRTQLNKLVPQGTYIVEDAIEYTPKEGDDLLMQ